VIRIRVGDNEYSLARIGGGAVAIVATLSALIAYGANITGMLPAVAWKTQAGHEADIADVRAELGDLEIMAQESEKAIIGAIGNLRDEWKCDEYKEELDVLLAKVDAGTATAQDEERIRILRQKMGPISDDGLNCAQFED